MFTTGVLLLPSDDIYIQSENKKPLWCKVTDNLNLFCLYKTHNGSDMLETFNAISDPFPGTRMWFNLSYFRFFPLPEQMWKKASSLCRKQKTVSHSDRISIYHTFILLWWSPTFHGGAHVTFARTSHAWILHSAAKRDDAVSILLTQVVEQILVWNNTI